MVLAGTEQLGRARRGPRRQEVYEWMEEKIHSELNEQGSVDTPAVADGAAEYCLAAGDAFLSELLREMLRPEAYQLARRVIRNSRAEEIVDLGGDLMPRGEFERRARRNWQRFTVNVAPHRDMLFMQMYPEDIESWRWQRKKLRDRYEVDVRLADTLLKEVPKAKRIEEVYTPEEIEEIYQRIEMEVKGE